MSFSCSSSGGSGWKEGEEDAATATRLVVKVGATGTGKTILSIDSSRAVSGEVVNADKIQLYAGLDVTTNKVSLAERRGVPHHLLGAVHPEAGEPRVSSFRSLAATTAASIAARGQVPVAAGWSNSLIHALLANPFDAGVDPFSPDADRYRPALRFPCCLLWVDIEEALPAEYLAVAGLGKSIGVLELGDYLAGRKSIRAGVDDIKANTRLLATLVSKILRMADAWGWPVRRLDASTASTPPHAPRRRRPGSRVGLLGARRPRPGPRRRPGLPC